jgi:hypothetical protein
MRTGHKRCYYITSQPQDGQDFCPFEELFYAQFTPKILRYYHAYYKKLVLLLGIFRRAPCHAATRAPLCPFTSPGGTLHFKKKIYDTSSMREPSKALNVLKLMEKHFIDPKRSEIMSVFQVFSLYDADCPFGQNGSLPFSLRSLDIPALLKS